MFRPAESHAAGHPCSAQKRDAQYDTGIRKRQCYRTLLATIIFHARTREELHPRKERSWKASRARIRGLSPAPVLRGCDRVGADLDFKFEISDIHHPSASTIASSRLICRMLASLVTAAMQLNAPDLEENAIIIQ